LLIGQSIWWYIGAGFLLGWVMSTLIEWIWFRQRRVRPESAGRARESTVRGIVAEREALAAERVAASTTAPTTTQSTTDVRPMPSASSYPDPLWRVRGIGVIYQKRLYEAGIFTWHQLASSDVESVRNATQAPATSDPTLWIAQARELAEQFDRVGASYTGPVPDDFTRIDGIGSLSEQTLYRAGIFTYKQLADLSPQALARLLPEAAAAGESIDFKIWLDQAAQLSRES
jgi:predicted flap endonuclease-1-like 5' DNA nuclease